MSFDKEKGEIIRWSRLLNQKGFVTARSGNISFKVNRQKILITAHDSYLGHLEEEDILLIDLEGNIIEGEKDITSEKLLHLDIHTKFTDFNAILHAHSPCTVAFFHYFESLDIFSFEGRFYLGNIKVIPQVTPVVSDTKPVTEALEDSNIVVLRDHGVVSVGKDFKEPFGLIELLEEQAKINLIMRRLKA
ncbi:MAG: class II aldolase/adducin family protein [Desulfobacterales bacterium]|nr:class II aldolase/adducin family protein [Desulfobacterales bacterium]